MTRREFQTGSCVGRLVDASASLGLVGGKARNLGAMLRAGLPVPDGLVITTDAYRAFVAANGLDAVIDEAWGAAREGGAEALERASSRLRAAFEAGGVPPAIDEAIRRAIGRHLGGGAVAVRSSATAEDLEGASFAGQQDTYLGVRGEAAIVEAVRRCWGSLWTARAMSYRARRGIAPRDVALAVVVQRLVPARVAGVMFTVHPVTGATDQLVVNATFGLGEALVSGRVNPDTIIAEKATGRALRVELGDKAVMTVARAEGTTEVAVAAERRGRRAVDEAALIELARAGRALEALFGAPQDVEFALVGDDPRPVLLQSRAITTVAPTPGDDAWPCDPRGEPQAFDFWTQQDVGERWPDALTPLTWSFSDPMNQTLMDGLVAGLNAPYAGKIRWTKRAFGHAYMNEGALLYAYTHGIGMPLRLVRSGLTHPGARPTDAEGWRVGRALAHLPFFWAAATSWERSVDAMEADFPKIDAWVDAFMARDLGAAADASLLGEARGLWYERVLAYVASHTHATSLAMSAYAAVEAQLARWGLDASLAQVLAGGLSGVIAAEMVPDLSSLAATLRRLRLERVVLRAPPAQALTVLRGEPRARAFLEELGAFLRRHGHRCMVEAELRNPRWSEAPELVVEQLAATLRAPPVTAAASARAEARRLEATAEIEARLGRLPRATFRWALARMQRFTRLRDNGQHYVVKLLLPIRRLYATLGARFAARGWLREADDVFFLVVDEIAALAAADAAARGSAQGRADARRAAFESWRGAPPPDALDAAQQPVAPAEVATAEGDTEVLVGLAASRGVVTGTARVVLTPAEASRLQPGDILVTRATDPGWTPAFASIGGAVLEIGGLLSHGAIVAREYEIPAVVNVVGATRRIRDGQTISVDGAAGRVSLGP